MLIQLVDDETGNDILSSYHADWLPPLGCPVTLANGDTRFVAKMSARIRPHKPGDERIVQTTCLHLSKTKPERPGDKKADQSAESSSQKPKS